MSRSRSGWNRSSPWIGALGGLLVSLSHHVLGVAPGEYRVWSVYDLLGSSLDVPRLLSAYPVASTVVLVGVGAVLGWVGRAVRPRN